MLVTLRALQSVEDENREEYLALFSEPIKCYRRELFSKQYTALFEDSHPEICHFLGLALPPTDRPRCYFPILLGLSRLWVSGYVQISGQIVLYYHDSGEKNSNEKFQRPVLGCFMILSDLPEFKEGPTKSVIFCLLISLESVGKILKGNLRRVCVGWRIYSWVHSGLCLLCVRVATLRPWATSLFLNQKTGVMTSNF